MRLALREIDPFPALAEEMPFPETSRVIYDKPPLVDVICQLKFPTILKIEAEQPVQFQECLRTDYPILRQMPPVDLSSGLPTEVAKIFSAQFPGVRLAYEFASADEFWKVNLTNDFLALICSKYERWEGFKEHLQKPLDALTKAYRPAFFSRIGLRYRDVIRRSAMGPPDAGWATLLAPHIAGELSDSRIAASIAYVFRDLHVRLSDNGDMVRLIHGFVQDQNKEVCYLFDADFFVEQKTELNDAIKRLDYFNQQAGRLFRWCITEHLHRAMGPRQL